MLSKAIIFREMKSESGFSFAMASQPFNFKGLGLNMGTHCVELIKGWLAIAKLKPLSLFISLNIIAIESI